MKKAILSILLVLVLGFLCCGCDELDQMREQHAFYYESDGIKTSDGSIYRKLPGCDELSFDLDYENIYVTTPDVPVLASSFSGRVFHKSVDGLFLISNAAGTHYCREDIFESVNKQITGQIIYENIGYEYYEKDGNKWKKKYYTLTESQEKLFSQIYENAEEHLLANGASLKYDYLVDLYMQSADGYFKRDIADIYMDDGNFYIVKSKGNGRYYCNVPQEYSIEFAKIINKHVEYEKRLNILSY